MHTCTQQIPLVKNYKLGTNFSKVSMIFLSHQVRHHHLGNTTVSASSSASGAETAYCKTPTIVIMSDEV